MVEVKVITNKTKDKHALKTIKGITNTIVKVGFFENAKYPSGEQVAQVAFNNEYGTGNIPERPFIRKAAAITTKQLKAKNKKINILKFNEEKYTNTVGAVAKGNIQQQAIDIKSPPNTKETIKRKGGKSNPLINTGFMLESVHYVID